MRENDKLVLIYSSLSSVAEGERIGGALVDQGLVACIDIFPGMTAIYVSEGSGSAKGAAMISKTRASLASPVVAEARNLDRRGEPDHNPGCLSVNGPHFLCPLAPRPPTAPSPLLECPEVP